MDFFGRQEGARRATRRLVVLFVLALAAVVVVVNAVVLAVAGVVDPAAVSRTGIVVWTTLVVAGVIGIASLCKTAALRSGGGQVAVELGGRRVLSETADPLQRRLLNVVEEMAIASGIPMPEVYVLENEAGINAFAAGWGPADAAVAVTRGALAALDRNELQGVIGHEFSHILNGDMRLNTRLIGLLFGLMIITLAGRVILYNLPRAGRAGRGNAGTAIAGIGAVGLALLAAGQVGFFFGRLIQTAVARNRERLADAAAVQFTRDPVGLRNALVKIGAGRTGSRIVQPAADEIAHMLFAPARRAAFATHPPLVERIRALDPGFDRKEFGAMRRALDAKEESSRVPSPTAGPGARERLDALLGTAVLAAPAAVEALVGNPAPVHMEFAAVLRESLPPDVHAAAVEPEHALALLVALALERQSEVRQRQLAFVRGQLGAAVAAAVVDSLVVVDALHVAQRMPALLALLPCMHQLPRQERLRLLDTLTGMLGREGGQVSIFAYALRKLAQVHLRDEIDPPATPRHLGRRAVAGDLQVLLSVLAWSGHDGNAGARLAFERGMSRWGVGAAFSRIDNWPARLDQALNRLDRLAPRDKAAVVGAMVETIGHDGRLTLEEAELLRAICGALHCPLPPLL